MTIRSELETKLATYATSKGYPVAWEGFPFTPPNNGVFLQPILLAPFSVCPTLDGIRTRTRGIFQVNVIIKDGVGSKDLESVVADIVALYPILPKSGEVSVEEPAQRSAAILLLDKRMISVSINYRHES